MHVSLTRSYHFSASHRLHSPKLDAAANAALYRECDNVGGHGHNFRLWVTVSGPLDPRTGMLVDLAALDAGIAAQVLRRVDHRFLSAEYLGVPADPAHPEPWIATSENLLRLIHPWVLAALPPGAGLDRLALEETPLNRFEYAGEQPLTYTGDGPP